VQETSETSNRKEKEKTQDSLCRRVKQIKTGTEIRNQNRNTLHKFQRESQNKKKGKKKKGQRVERGKKEREGKGEKEKGRRKGEGKKRGKK